MDMTDGGRLVAKTPKQIVLDTEILVLGGGLPGVCAAIQAAECGRKVILVERSLVLGGNCGPEIGVHPSDAHRFHSYMVSTGIVGRLLEDTAFVCGKTFSNDHHYNISMQWDAVMRQALERAGVLVLLCHYAHTPYMDGSRIAAVLCEDTLTYKRVLIRVSHFVIDDTGDGNVSELAGARYRMGREARSEFQERLAPEEADRITMGMSLVSLIRNTGGNAPFIPPENTPAFYPGYGGETACQLNDRDSLYFWFPTETGGEIDAIEDAHEIYRRVRGHLDSAWNEMKNGKYEEYNRNWEMVWVSSRMGKRESRRFEGDYWLNENDCENGRIFEDAIGVGGFALDIHYPKPENPEYVSVKYHAMPPVYTIPYRCVYSKNIENLFFASRLMSVTHIAHGTTRVQRTLAALGQAVGMAAALCTEYGVTPRGLLTEGHLEELQQRLLREDCTIPNCQNLDEKDLARKAKVSASSETVYGVIGQVRFEAVEKAAGAELWDFEDHLDYAEFLLRNTTDEARKITCTLERFVPEHPWQTRGERAFFDDQTFHNEAEWGNEWRIKYFQEVARDEAVLPPHFEGYVKFRFNAKFAPKNPLTDDDRIALVVRCEEEGVEIGRCDRFYSYVRSIEGYSLSREGETQYNVRPRSCFYRLSPAPPYGGAAQVLNGRNRRFSENPHNMWHPVSLPADLTLSWEQPITLREVRITFDTLERTAWEMPYENNARVSPQCVKKYKLTFLLEGKEVYTHAEDDWHNRLAKIRVPAVKADRLILTLEEIWDPSRIPGVYEIRAYGSAQE